MLNWWVKVWGDLYIVSEYSPHINYKGKDTRNDKHTIAKEQNEHNQYWDKLNMCLLIQRKTQHPFYCINPQTAHSQSSHEETLDKTKLGGHSKKKKA